MGTDDLAERAWLQGLIKLAAAYVHLVRRNPAGVARNLEGARSRLVEATKTSRIVPLPGDRALDLRGLIDAIDQRLTDLADHPNGPTLPAPSLPYLDGRRTR